LRLLDRDAGRETPENLERGPLSGRVLEGVHAQRDPELVAERECKTFRHDANDRPRNAAEAHRSTDDVGVPREMQLPRLVADDEDRWGRIGLVRRQQIAAQQRGCVGDRKGRRGDFRHFHGLGCGLCRHQIVLRVSVGADVLDRGQLRPERGEFVHQPFLFATGLRPNELQLDDAIAAGNGQHRVEHA
jgi:hypothetical protein